MDLEELVVTGPKELKFKSYRERKLRPNQVRAKAILSGISHGTELNLYRGTVPFYNKVFDMKMRLFLEGENFSSYPIKLGYEWVGRVIEVGEEVRNYKEGDLIHLPLGHCTTHTFAEDIKSMYGMTDALPNNITPDKAVFLSLGGVALQAIHDAHIKIGDRIAVFGLGTIGLLTIQLAKLNGASWVDAVDPIPMRREFAKNLGADAVYNPLECDAAKEIKSSSPNYGADIAIEISGNYNALHEAIRSVKISGTVVAAGFYQGEAKGLRLGEEWHHNRITMHSSMGVWGNPHRDYPSWDRNRIHETVIELLEKDKISIDNFITHRIPFKNASEAYELIDKNPKNIIKIVLKYD
jgi:2-desacetyl-2-hydroxyethyl bacteriochlorophyllide A dehydrogenase